jgi:hypothetical protein
MKERFDSAGQDEVMAAECAILWQSFTAGVIIMSMFCPLLKGQSSENYIQEREFAAQSPKDMLNFMTRYVRAGVEIKQPKSAELFANLIFKLTAKDPSQRVTDQKALTHPALTHMIFTKEVLDSVQGAGYLIPGGRGPAGSDLADVESAGWLLKPDGPVGDNGLPDGTWGIGGFAARPIKKGDFAGWYAAVAHDMTDKVSIAEYPPCFANVTILDGSDAPKLTAIGELPLEVLYNLRAPGVFFNSKSAGNGANLSLDRRRRFVTEGRIIMIPFYALDDIAEGEGGYWEYTPDKGCGGANSYMFDDAAFEIGSISVSGSRM